MECEVKHLVTGLSDKSREINVRLGAIGVIDKCSRCFSSIRVILGYCSERVYSFNHDMVSIFEIVNKGISFRAEENRTSGLENVRKFLEILESASFRFMDDFLEKS
jgi:hypothetical protein